MSLVDRLKERGPLLTATAGLLLLLGAATSLCVSCMSSSVKTTADTGAVAAEAFGAPVVGPYLKNLAARMEAIEEAEGKPVKLGFTDILREAVLALGGGLTAGAGMAARRDRSRAAMLAATLSAAQRVGPNGIDADVLDDLAERGVPKATIRRANALAKKPRRAARAA